MVHQGPQTSESLKGNQPKGKDEAELHAQEQRQAASNQPRPDTQAQAANQPKPAKIAPEDQPKTRTDIKQGFAPIEPKPAESSRVPARVPPLGAEGASSSGQTQGGEGHAPAAPTQPVEAAGRPRRVFGIGPETLNTAEAQAARKRFDVGGRDDETVIARDATVTVKK